MRRAGLLAAVLSLAALMPAGPASAAATTAYRAAMTAEEEVPMPGPAGAKGTADFTVDNQAGTLCYTLTYSGITKPTAAHIHEGAKGVAGPVYVDLDMPKNGDKGCVPIDKTKAQAIAGNPAGYYANIHTADHPKGAMRGQLAPA
jgi:hypothetical protein